MERYRILGKKGEGTFSDVLKCQSIRDGTFWAVKRMKQLYKSLDEIQRIREIRVLRQLNGHPNMVFLREIIFDKRSGVLCMIFELMTMNLYEYIRDRKRLLSNETVSKFMCQLLKALEFLHRHSFFHRDVKPENILIKDDVLKLADFGSCRQTFAKQPFTEYISTRWYRAPESLLTNGYYRDLTDIWSAGCVMYEIATLRPLFPGTNELDQISKIHDVLGTPSPATLEKFQHRNTAVDFNFPPRRGTGIARRLTHCSSLTIDLITQLCAYDPDERITAADALRHSYFDTLREQEDQPIQKVDDSKWNPEERVVKTSEDNYSRVSPNSSSSSQSSGDVPIVSTEPNVYNLSTESNVYTLSTTQESPTESKFNRLVYPTAKAQPLLETRNQGQAMQKSPIQHKRHSKSKVIHSNYHYTLQNQSQFYPNNPSFGGTNGLPYYPSTNMHIIKNNPSSFLPRISGASAFSNHPIDTGYPVLTNNKSHYPIKHAAGYYPIISYRSYKK